MFKKFTIYLTSGLLIGWVLSLGLYYPYITAHLHNLSRATHLTHGGFAFVLNSFMGYLPTLILIWLIGRLAPRWGVLQYILVLFRGIPLGFVTALFLANYGGTGIIYTLLLFTPQSIVLLATYFFLIYSRQKYAFLELALAFTMVFFIAMYEGFILPRLITFILG